MLSEARAVSQSFEDFLTDCAQQTRIALEQALPAATGPAKTLYEAMRYSMLNGGKRIRPLLCFAAARAVGRSDRNVAQAAVALEMIHAYSLIHDDLPAMDDDLLRRGKPTCHIAFDEATAILAGDGLQALAFEQLTNLHDVPPTTVVALVQTLARAAGCAGMVAGQAIDLASTGRQITFEQLQEMHCLKTGALIEASVLMGAMVTGNATEQQLDGLSEFARHIGLAFQVQDDILDVESSTDQLGKTQGADEAQHKATYTSILGIEQAHREAEQLYQSSLTAIAAFDAQADYLRDLARLIVQRDR